MSDVELKYLTDRLNVLESKLDTLQQRFYISLGNLVGIVVLVILRIVEGS